MDLQVLQGDKVLCDSSMWVVLNKSTLSAYRESDLLDQPEHIFDLFDASLSSQSGGILHIKSRHMPCEWILQSSDANLTTTWQEMLKSMCTFAKRQGPNKVVSRALTFNKLLEEQEKGISSHQQLCIVHLNMRMILTMNDIYAYAFSLDEICIVPTFVTIVFLYSSSQRSWTGSDELRSL